METTLERNSYLSHFIGVLVVLMAFTDILQERILLIASAATSIVVFILCFPLKNKNHFSESMLFILILLGTSLLNLFFTENNFGGSLTLLGNLLLSFLYINFNNKKLTLWVVLSYLITILFIGYHLFVLNTHENLIYEGLSRNHAGFAVIFWTIFLLFHLKLNHNYLPLFPAIIALVLSFFLVGRTSLIVSSILLMVVFYYKFIERPRILFIAMCIFIGLCYFLWLTLGTDIITNTNLDSGLDTPRWELWQIYWENLNFLNLLTGVDVTHLPMYNEFGGNPHNSFIKFHSRVGIGCFFLVALYFVSAYKYLKKKNNYILWLLILLTMRAFFDSDILIGNFDFIFFIVTFYWIKTE
ncbi:hypothetical protein [Pareuzebyella sediminis]|uniref:hypothetical protein n=1 Tax=Pareuzebyella sediminis TaxID=2607998 RepID=UPI0011ED1308|nr:hypothetical protein [Pareuzebyella sediminis]